MPKFDNIELLNQARRAEFLTVEQLAALLQYTPRTVYRQIRAGQIEGVIRHGRSIRIHKRAALATFHDN